jgi:hypothetical protein
MLTAAPGWLEPPCSNKLLLTATSSAGMATDTITVSFVDVRYLPNAVLDFFVKNGISIRQGVLQRR